MDNEKYDGILERYGGRKYVVVYVVNEEAGEAKQYDVDNQIWRYCDIENYYDLYDSEAMLTVMNTLSREEAEKITQTELGLPEEIDQFLKKWCEKKETYRKEWREMGGWPAKHVRILYSFRGKQYEITPDMIGLERGDSWDEGFLEYLCKYIVDDLKEIGAEFVGQLGFLD